MLYMISRNGQTFGPYTPEDVQRYLASGNILPTDLAYAQAAEDQAAAFQGQAAAPESQTASGEGWLPVGQIFGSGQTSGSTFGQSAPPPGQAFSTAAHNPYMAGPPGSYVQPAESTSPGWRGEYPYFPVSPLKFCVMSFVTAGLYQVYWAYKQWVRIKAETGEDLMPWARALFLGIWNFPLFSRVRDQAATEEMPVGWNHIVLGVLVLLFSLSGRLPGAIGLLVFFSFVAYLPVVLTIDKLNRKHAPDVSEQPNSRFSGWNIAGIVLGGLFMVLATIGILLGPHTK